MKGDVIGIEEEGWWQIESLKRVKGHGNSLKDINEHLKVLLELLVPQSNRLIEMSKNGERFFDVLWESTYLYAGTGLLVNAEHLQGIAKLKTGMGFDINQIDENKKEKTV